MSISGHSLKTDYIGEDAGLDRETVVMFPESLMAPQIRPFYSSVLECARVLV